MSQRRPKDRSHWGKGRSRLPEPAPPEPQRAEASQSWEDVYRTQTAAIARLEAERDAAIRARDELRKRTSNLLACKNCEERAEKAESEAQALRARTEKLEQLIRETLSRRSKSREHKFAMPTECGTWDRMEALLSESEK